MFVPSVCFHWTPRISAIGALGSAADAAVPGVNATFFYGADKVGAAVQAGVDCNCGGRWSAKFGVKQILLNTTASIDSGTITQ